MTVSVGFIAVAQLPLCTLNIDDVAFAFRIAFEMMAMVEVETKLVGGLGRLSGFGLRRLSVRSRAVVGSVESGGGGSNTGDGRLV